MRLLKDFKNLISEKNVPKSIKFLRNAVLFVTVMLLCLISVDLAFNLKELTEIRSGIKSINTAYQRVDTIAEVTWKLRKLQLFAMDIYVPPASQNSTEFQLALKKTLAGLVDRLRNITLEVASNQANISSLGFAQVESESVTVQTAIQTGTNREYRPFSDSIIQFASHADSVISSDISFFKKNDITDSTKASFFYVRRNGLFSLRAKSEDNAQAFYNFFLDETSSYDSKLLIFMIVGLGILLVSEAVLVPIVFSVHRTATKVLSLFGYITAHEVYELAEKCEIYMNTFLEHRHEQQGFEEEKILEGIVEEHKVSKTLKPGQIEYLEVSQNHEDLNNSRNHIPVPVESEDKAPTANDKTSKGGEKDNPIKTDNSKAGMSPEEAISVKVAKSIQSRKLLADTKLLNVKEIGNKKEAEAEDEIEQANAHSMRLLNSKDNNRGQVIFQFTTFTLLIAAYFVADYATERNSQSNIKMSLEHMRLLSRINLNFKYLISFTLEEIAESPVNAYTFPTFPYMDQREYYSTQSLDAYKKLIDSARQSFPSQFDNYMDLFSLYSSDDLCTNFYGQDVNSQTNCLNIAGQLLTRGLILTTTRIVQLSDDAIKEYNATIKDTTSQKVIISGDKFKQMEDLLNMMAPVVLSLQSYILLAFQDYLDQIKTLEKVKFSLFIIFNFVIFVVVWVPYLRRLKEKIFRTKGMLNMIPMNIITKNENLKSAFIQGDILRAVK